MVWLDGTKLGEPLTVFLKLLFGFLFKILDSLAKSPTCCLFFATWQPFSSASTFIQYLLRTTPEDNLYPTGKLSEGLVTLGQIWIIFKELTISFLEIVICCLNPSK